MEKKIKTIGSLNPQKEVQDRVRVFNRGHIPGNAGDGLQGPDEGAEEMERKENAIIEIGGGGQQVGREIPPAGQGVQRQGADPGSQREREQRMHGEEMAKKTQVIGQMHGAFESLNRVYDRKQICPTVTTCGGDREPKVIKLWKRKEFCLG